MAAGLGSAEVEVRDAAHEVSETDLWPSDKCKGYPEIIYVLFTLYTQNVTVRKPQS